jgi:uncharacterized protein (TIRG00374 family)
VLLIVTGVSLYLVFPSLIEVFSSWPRLVDVQPWWLVPMVLLEAASFFSIVELQRICLRTRAHWPVFTAQLAGNAFSRIVPGGAAAGAAVQYPMLVDAGVRRARVASGLATANLVTFGVLLALPLAALPTIVLGLPISRGLTQAAIMGAIGFVVIAGMAIAVAVSDVPLRLLGRAAQAVRNRVRSGGEPVHDLPERLIAERDHAAAALGRNWWKALLFGFGWWLFDYSALLLALAAIGASPDPSLVLVAYAGGLLLSMIPLTPGGLGFVEAGLTGLLALAGIGAADAALATLAYRLVSYWLPIPLGAAAAVVHRRHDDRARAPHRDRAGDRTDDADDHQDVADGFEVDSLDRVAHGKRQDRPDGEQE